MCLGFNSLLFLNVLYASSLRLLLLPGLRLQLDGIGSELVCGRSSVRHLRRRYFVTVPALFWPGIRC